MVIVCDNIYNNSKYDRHFELYPYPLSPFQKYAIEGIIEGHHVLVTAHTGSGKTLPAEFAIQYFKKQSKKIIYTSPIKALSNQKFYEFSNKYPDITFGLFTGDIKTNPNADVLIMTTEILMNYLFSFSSEMQNHDQTLSFQMDIQNELACVIFDEVHYINDKDRGQVWEQTILMLPEHVQMVLLSATIDNPTGFANWIENRSIIPSENRKKVYLASTEHRVVPLTHYAFLTTTESPFKEIKDKEIQKQIRDSTNQLITLYQPKGPFSEKGYYEIKKITDLFSKHRFFMKRKFVLNRLAQELKEKEMLPAIVFVFSRKHVETSAHDITTNLLEDDSKVPYIMRRECEQIVRKFPNYKEYLELPEYNDLVGLLEKGIGIHHSGMIPVLREIVELMISKKYIKLLFATESFAIGLDCPIKTAVFSSLTKYDGHELRYLMPHEYTQMAGRAGRRGIDTVGHVVHCNNLFELPSLNQYIDILCGKPQKLVSKFKITYNMIMNLMKNGKTNHFNEFVDKSMMKNEIDKNKNGSLIELANYEESYNKKISIQLKTPIEVCNEYLELEINLEYSKNKKRKEIERTMNNLKDCHKWILEDVAKMKETEKIKQNILSEKSQIEYLEQYSKIHVDKICGILVKLGFIIYDENEIHYKLTQSGEIASNINEIHSLIATDILLKWNYFEKFSIQQIISLFSMFTDIHILEEYKINYPNMDDLFLKESILEIKKITDIYYNLEQESDIYTGINYDELIIYDLCSLIIEWSTCNTEQQCKYFIQTRLFEREISLGDFTKAVLKIAVIVKEFINVCEIVGQIDCLYKLKQIEPIILKYVTTSQSLYV